MPKDPSIKKVLVIGSGPIVIGQAAEFDYAGTQACRVLKQEGVETVLVNSNPATIMTDNAMADAIYLEPLTTETIKRIILETKPDSLLAGLGGQTGLTIAMELDHEGFLKEHNVRLIGTNAKAIDKAIFPGTQGGPLEHVIAAKAVCFGEALKPEFKEYQHQVRKNAAALAEALTAQGFKLVSGGTDNHLMLVDLTGLDVSGKELQNRCDEVYITLNKNAVPNDPRSPFVTSGVRIGTPAITSRGLKEEDMPKIAECIWLAATDFENKADYIRAEVTKLCEKYPIYK